MIKQEISTEESIARILSTPLGSRVMNPEYGSRLFELIDKTADDEWVLLASDFTYEAIEKNEPRVAIQRVKISTGANASIDIVYLENDLQKSVSVALSEVSNATA